jgi:hypothetical protein
MLHSTVLCNVMVSILLCCCGLCCYRHNMLALSCDTGYTLHAAACQADNLDIMDSHGLALELVAHHQMLCVWQSSLEVTCVVCAAGCCRRAAASAFQECVGRLSSFPHGLDILAVADYYSVGGITNAYLQVAPFVAQFHEYRAALVHHLMSSKLRHWDRAIRGLAAVGLAALVPVAGELLQQHALPHLLSSVTDDVLEVRAGAMLGIAELLPALATAGVEQLDSIAVAEASYGLQGSAGAAVVGVLERLEAAKMYRGKSGEVMREVAARFLEQVAAAHGGLRPVPLLAAFASKKGCAGFVIGDTAGQQQKQQRQSSRAASNDNGADADVSDVDDADGEDATADSCAGTGGSRQQQQQQPSQQQRLLLPLTAAFHDAALRLCGDCLSHVQNSIQMAGVAALKAYAAAFQPDTGPRAALQALMQHCCSRLTDRWVLTAAGQAGASQNQPRHIRDGVVP